MSALPIRRIVAVTALFAAGVALVFAAMFSWAILMFGSGDPPAESQLALAGALWLAVVGLGAIGVWGAFSNRRPKSGAPLGTAESLTPRLFREG